MPLLAPTLPELAERIRATAATVTLALLYNMWIEVEYRYHICLANHGALIEHLQNVGHTC
jgi:hypothetical protein